MSVAYPLRTKPITRRQWLALVLVGTAQFVVVMDSSIIGVSLSNLQSALNFDTANLSWVFNAYVLAFGGLLLLGGRLVDTLGARRMFLAGWIGIAVGSVLAGSAWDAKSEIAGRAIQGASAALIAPAALALLVATFADTPALDRAFTVYGALAPLGGTAGVFFGGLLTEYANWRWIFYVTIPVAVIVIAATPFVLPASPGDRGEVGAWSAATVTAGLTLVVYGLVEASDGGWASRAVFVSIVAGVALLVVFFIGQIRARNPLLRLGLFKLPRLAAANSAQLLLGASWIPTWFFLNLVLQNVHGATPLEAGMAMAPMIVTTAVVMTVVVPRLLTRFGDRRVICAGFFTLALSMSWLALASDGGEYLTSVLPASLLASIGMAFAFVPTLSAAVNPVSTAEAGIASALVNTSYQVGSAFGLALVTSLSTKFSGALTGNTYGSAFACCAVLALGGAAVAWSFLRPLRRHG